jgi:PAS domain S-box-containing protein
VSISTDGLVLMRPMMRPARRLPPVPAATRIDTALRDNELQFRELLEALPAAVYTIDAEGRITFFNEAAADLWGCRPELGKSEWCGSWRLFWPDGRPMRHDECPMAVALKEGRPIRGAEAAAGRPDGTRVPFLAYPTPLRDRSGALTGAVNTLIDITERKRNEEFEQQFAAIVESSNDAILSEDLDGIIKTWNPGAKRVFGYTAEEVIGKPITLLIPIDRHGEESDILSRIRRGERIDYYETVRRRKDGSLIEISVTASPLKNAEGRIIGASKIARDITERRRTEQLTRRLASIVESSDDAIVSKDLDGIIKTWNPGAERLFGYTAEEVIGKPITLLIPIDRHDEEPDILSRIRRGECIDHYETVRRRNDGSLIEISVTVSPIKNAEGRIIGASKIARDITERRRTEQLTRRLASIVESSDDAIVSKDLDGIIKTWNPGAERLFGYTAEEVIGKPITLLIPIDRHDEEPDILSRIRRGERIDHYETVRRRKDGSLVEISLTVSPIKNAEGTVVGASKTARDITERRRAQEQQNLLVREMSHRVKNLFAVASGLVTLSARSARTPADMAEAVRDRLCALARAHGLTRPGLLNGGEKPGQDATLHALVQTIFAPYVDPERVKDHGFFIVTGPCLPIGGNAVTSVALVMHELATNAAKYGALSTFGGYVHIDWSVKKDELLLTWKEHGGPSLDGPAEHEGFGSSLVRRIVTGQFGGQLSYDWKPKGLIIRLSVPVERLAM